MIAQEFYTIGDAAKQVQVETHVLRYWEEELGLSIRRNAQGHRCYTRENLELLENIRKWKEQGFHLKAIRMMLAENGKFAVPQEVVREAQAMVEKESHEERGTEVRTKAGEELKEADEAGETEERKAEGTDSESSAPALHGTTIQAPSAPGMEHILLDERTSKAAKLQFLLENLVSRTVQENNAVLLKELDYQFRQLEENAQAREQKHWEREEEHFRKLDELLCQRGRRKDKRKKRSFS